MTGAAEIFMLLLTSLPSLVFWIALIVFAAWRLRRGGGRAERFLLAGGIVKIADNLLRLPSVFIVPWLIDRGYPGDPSTAADAYGVALNVIGMAGIICLIYAFWVKFKERKTGAAAEAAPH